MDEIVAQVFTEKISASSRAFVRSRRNDQTVAMGNVGAYNCRPKVKFGKKGRRKKKGRKLLL